MAMPTVTVVIPCFNHGRFVAEAVRSCLSQEGCDGALQVVIVNDGSTDGTSATACDVCTHECGDAVHVIHQENRGLPAARNAGANAALADRPGLDYLVFLDADDWIRPGFVARLHAAIENDADPASVSHAYCQEELVELGTGIWTVPAWDPLLVMITNLHPVTALVKASCFAAVGGFDESMRDGYEDWDFWLKMNDHGWRGVRVREPLFVWRRHSAVTMVTEAVQRHERLFRQIVSRHAATYARHIDELLVMSNVLLRNADANWLDEEHRAIVLRDLRAWTTELVQERDEARIERDALRAEREALAARAEALSRELEAVRGRAEGEAASARAAREELARTSAMYEAKPVIKASRTMHKAVEGLPPVISRPILTALRGLGRMGKGR
jgi:glycosyltransferase involved in cell wall biosynthesis